MKIEKINETFLKLNGEPYIEQEISDHFSFKVPGYFFMPAYKNKMWDGTIKLYNTRTKLIYHGLVHYIEDFCQSRGYEYSFSEDIFVKSPISVQETTSFINSLNLPFAPRDYQVSSFIKAIEDRRMLLLSPTGSGKSLIIYMIARYLQRTMKRGLLVVPTVSLVAQMYKDFEDYGYYSATNCYTIYGGVDKNTTKFLTISTWQSIYKQDKKYFEQFDFVIGDEAHLFKAKSLTGILEGCVNAKYRIGTTGTLDGTNTHRLVLEGLFGPVYKATSTSDLIEKKQLSDFGINCLILNYPDDICKVNKKVDYSKELDFIVKCERRNQYIRNLALSLKGNSLVLFQFVDKHGKELYNMMKAKAPDRKIFFISGDIDVTYREDVRSIVENEDNAIIVASYGTFSTGTNIKNLDNIITASPTKSRVRQLQSIGRVLRLNGDNKVATLYDIADDFRIGSYVNHTLKHFLERLKMYDAEKFRYKMFKIDINGE